MKVERLDKILLRLGYVTEEQIARALQRQRARGGRLGSNLLYFKFLTQEQLAEALSEQYHVPYFRRDEDEVDPEIVRRLPREVAAEFMAVPFNIDRSNGTLLVAVANPESEDALYQIEHRLQAKRLKVHVAPESELRRLLDECHGEGTGSHRIDEIIDLPELFGSDPFAGERGEGRESEDDPPSDRVLLVSEASWLDVYLSPVFEREGLRLDVLSEPESIAQALRAHDYLQVIVAESSLADFQGWVQRGDFPAPRGEVSVFQSVSRSLLDNPVPYDKMMVSLLKTLRVIVRYRCSGLGWNPPYEFICRDIRALSRQLDFRRLVVDGLEIAAHLLLSEQAGAASGNADGQRLVLLDFDESLELARALQFPWDIEGLLHAFLGLISELNRADQADEPDEEMTHAAQVLALVWYRHSVFHNDEAPPKKIMAALKKALRAQAGRLASASLTESYITLLETTQHEMSVGAGKHVFVVSPPGPDATRFSAHLELAGYRTVQVADMDEADQMCRRHPPALVLVNYDAYPVQIVDFKRTAGAAAPIVFYAWTLEKNPTFVMDLIDAGFVDVFPAPLRHDLLVTRMSRAMQSQAVHGSALPRSGSFAASFEAFSFIELIQALGQSQKTVHIALANPRGEQADIYLRHGDITHARCGELEGEEAVYEVMSWGEDGWFSAEPVRDTPSANVSGHNDGILLEGCRRLDEATV